MSFNIISGANRLIAMELEEEASIGSQPTIHQQKDVLLDGVDREGYNEGTHLFTSKRNIKAGE